MKKENKKNAKSLAELNKMNPLTKKILIAATTLFTLGVVALAIFNVANNNSLKTPEEVSQNCIRKDCFISKRLLSKRKQDD